MNWPFLLFSGGSMMKGGVIRTWLIKGMLWRGTEPLHNIPFISQVLINTPFIIDPPENKRKGQFIRVEKNPLEGIELKSDEWLCYPAQVGPTIIFVYFH